MQTCLLNYIIKLYSIYIIQYNTINNICEENVME